MKMTVEIPFRVVLEWETKDGLAHLVHDLKVSGGKMFGGGDSGYFAYDNQGLVGCERDIVKMLLAHAERIGAK